MIPFYTQWSVFNLYKKVDNIYRKESQNSLIEDRPENPWMEKNEKPRYDKQESNKTA